MRLTSLVTLIRRDLVRSGGALATAGFGILAGTAALVFFIALGLGVRAALFSDAFPLDRVELEPRTGAEPGLFALLLSGNSPPPGIAPEAAQRVAQVPGVVGVYPKLRFAFPAGAFGGKELLGRDLGAHEILADGMEPALLQADISQAPFPFEDPLAKGGGPSCNSDADCASSQYCELPSGAAHGQCSAPVPALVSRYLVEIFNKGIAPAHGLPPVGMTLLSRAQGFSFTLELGVSMLGSAHRGNPRKARARIVGVSPSAIDLGLTFPLETVRRWNREFAGESAATNYSSVLVRVEHPNQIAGVIAAATAEGVEARDTRARDLSVLVSVIIGVLALVALVMLLVAASNIAYTFRVLIAERRSEIGLYRALGATAADIGWWVCCLAVVVGLAGGIVGLGLARLAAFFVNYLGEKRLPDFPFKPSSFFQFPEWLLAAGLGFGALFALVGALMAVRQAMRLDPARALAGS